MASTFILWDVFCAQVIDYADLHRFMGGVCVPLVLTVFTMTSTDRLGTYTGVTCCSIAAFPIIHTRITSTFIDVDLTMSAWQYSSNSSILFWRQIIIYKLIFTHVLNYNTNNDKPPGEMYIDITVQI